MYFLLLVAIICITNVPNFGDFNIFEIHQFYVCLCGKLAIFSIHRLTRNIFTSVLFIELGCSELHMCYVIFIAEYILRG
jgi:hypothetical protein